MIQRLKIRALIKYKGGASKVALMCGVSQPTVSKWASQGSIPVKYALLLEALWGIDADLLHNPWGVEARSWATDAEQEAIINGDYSLDLIAPRGSRKSYVDFLEPVEIEPFPEGYVEEDDGYVEPQKKSGWSDDELEEFLKKAEEGKL